MNGLNRQDAKAPRLAKGLLVEATTVDEPFHDLPDSDFSQEVGKAGSLFG
jgi:hypothetical protein